MWSVIPSLDALLQGLSVVFTQPSAVTFQQVLLGWVMCLGRRTEFRVFEALEGQRVSRQSRHPFDRFYNFFSRSAWSVRDLAHQVAVMIVTRLQPRGVLQLIVDSTLLHKRGAHVFAIGWFHDPVASTKKRVATALGNQCTVLGLAVRVPGVQRVFCLPIHAALNDPEGTTSPADAARQMLADVRQWFPDRALILVGDGGFSAKNLLEDLDASITYVGLMRGDAAIHEPHVALRRGRRGRKPKHGARLPNPRQAARKADAARSKKSRWRWRQITVNAYGKSMKFQVCAFQAVWPRVLGGRPIQVVLCRPLEAGYEDLCLFTTRLDAEPTWVIETYALRSSIEAAFKDSKQVMEIQKPQHWCQQSIEKLAPCVWFLQSMIQLWYFDEGRKLPEARAARKELGPWETEYSLRHMLRLLRRLTLAQLINVNSPTKPDLQQIIHQLENYLALAA